MPALMVGILLDHSDGVVQTARFGTIWNVRFTNGAIMKIWQGHLINLAEDPNINLVRPQDA